MCDYSLHLVKSRSAKVGDKLVSTKFANSITHGFAAVGEPDVAVCLLPGTEIAFDKNVVEYRNSLLPNRQLEAKVAQFRQIHMNNPKTHHDALEFPNGRILLVNRLCEGQYATVLQLPVTPRVVSEMEKQKLDSLGG
jgi:hypothetical protein